MTSEQKNAISVANLMARQYHQFQESEYRHIQEISKCVLNNDVVSTSGGSCRGICRLGSTQHCIGCGRHISEMSDNDT